MSTRASGGTADALASGASVRKGVGVQIPPRARGVVHELCGYEFTNPGSGVILGRDSCCVGVLGLPCRLWAAVQRDGGARVRCRVFVGAWKWPRPEVFGLGPFMAGGSASRGSHSVDVTPGLFARYGWWWPVGGWWRLGVAGVGPSGCSLGQWDELGAGCRQSLGLCGVVAVAGEQDFHVGRGEDESEQDGVLRKAE